MIKTTLEFVLAFIIFVLIVTIMVMSVNNNKCNKVVRSLKQNLKCPDCEPCDSCCDPCPDTPKCPDCPECQVCSDKKVLTYEFKLTGPINVSAVWDNESSNYVSKDFILGNIDQECLAGSISLYSEGEITGLTESSRVMLFIPEDPEIINSALKSPTGLSERIINLPNETGPQTTNFILQKYQDGPYKGTQISLDPYLNRNIKKESPVVLTLVLGKLATNITLKNIIVRVTVLV